LELFSTRPAKGICPADDYPLVREDVLTRQQQDEQFANWMREHSSIAVRTARAFEFNTEGQADLLQEILLAWWRSILHFPVTGNARQWLYRVSLNTALTWQRRECRRQQVIDRAAPFAQLVESIVQPADPVDRNAVAELYRAIQQLRPAERALIVLHLDGFSYEEIAVTFGISVNAVGSRLTRARDNLAKHLKGMPHYHDRV
jgi:RNA polymerase sigma factor (sigma-70 family)